VQVTVHVNSLYLVVCSGYHYGATVLIPRCSFDISGHLSYPHTLMVNKCCKDTTDRIYKENVAIFSKIASYI